MYIHLNPISSGKTIEPPEVLIPWLNYKDSLTKKLAQITGDAQLKVLSQVWEQPNWWDKQVAKLRDNVLHREILMLSHNVPCWYARTILPKLTYKQSPCFFDRINQESLGNLLFEQDKVSRSEIRYYSIDKNSIEYHWLTDDMHDHVSKLWVRLSVFLVNEHPLYLIEILLPGLLNVCNES